MTDVLTAFRTTMDDSPMRCSMTGIPIRDCGDGIWDDGEWISWAYLNKQIARQEAENGEVRIFDAGAEPKSPELIQMIDEAIFNDLASDEVSTLWGRIGELYVAERFGVVLSKECAQGHDGRLGNEMVEIKTITRTKRRPLVQVKRTGNFSLLAVVRVNEHHELDARIVRRENLSKGAGGKLATVSWNTACRNSMRCPPPPSS